MSSVANGTTSSVRVVSNGQVVPSLGGSTYTSLLNRVGGRFSKGTAVKSVRNLEGGVGGRPSLTLDTVSGIFGGGLSERRDLELMGGLNRGVVKLGLSNSTNTLLPSHVRFFVQSVENVCIYAGPSYGARGNDDVGFKSLAACRGAAYPSYRGPLLRVTAYPRYKKALLIKRRDGSGGRTFHVEIGAAGLGDSVFSCISSRRSARRSTGSRGDGDPCSPFVLTGRPGGYPEGGMRRGIFAVDASISEVGTVGGSSNGNCGRY